MNAVVTKIRGTYRDLDPEDIEGLRNCANLFLTSLTTNQNPGLKSHLAYKSNYLNSCLKVGPLPVVGILKSLGFDLYRKRFDNSDQLGLMAVDSSLPEINSTFKKNRVMLVSDDLSTADQRFTIAHEIAHYLFDYDEVTHAVYYNNHLSSDKLTTEELRANRFAVELLAPEETFKSRYNLCMKKYNSSLPDIVTDLSNTFDITVDLVNSRLLDLGLTGSSNT